jgi:hypothetical protein
MLRDLPGWGMADLGKHLASNMLSPGPVGSGGRVSIEFFPV